MENYGFVKCAIANFNGKLSNPKVNAAKIKDLIDKSLKKGVKILVLPELSLTGYSCQDLFVNSDLLNDSLTYLQEIIHHNSLKSTNDLLTLVGMPIEVNDKLYNCAVAIQNKKILGVVPKQYIPNHEEFYEKRWFSAYTDSTYTEITLLNQIVPFGNIIFSSSYGYKLGIEICEDLWSVIPPSLYLTLGGANIIANLSASNELVGKNDYRKELVKTQSSRTISAYLYSSAGFSESTSDLVFGGSGYAFENGKELACLKRYEMQDQLEIFDVDFNYLKNERLNNKTFADSKNNCNIKFANVSFIQHHSDKSELSRFINPHPFVPDIEDKQNGHNVYKEIISIQSTALARRLSSIGCKNVTIGISGGLDSTLALLVCYEAFNKLKLDTKGIIGITMPGFGTTKRTYDNSVQLCNKLGITLFEIPIREACMQHFKDINHNPEIHDITYENVQARERTQILMDMANKYNGIVIGTGDLSELILGWCTYNGDHISMYNVNGSIPKTLVKTLIEWYAKFQCSNNKLKSVLLDIIDTPISPELLPTDGKTVVQKTENAVGPYEVIDFFIYHLLRNKFSKEKIIFLAEHAFKGKYSREEIISYYNRFIKRFFNNQFKRNCVPDGPKIGSVGISPRGDLRMPSDADYSNWIYNLQ